MSVDKNEKQTKRILSQKNIDYQMINEIFEENGYKFTSNPLEAIYIFPNGAMVDGEYDYGTRSLDHRMIECLFDDIDRYHNDFWDRVHNDFRVVRLIPESRVAMIRTGQPLSEIQNKIINAFEFEIEEY